MQTKPKVSNDVVPFVVTYNPALPRISNILRKHFNILHSSNRCKDVFKQPPFVAYRRSSNLRDLLVKAQLPVISTNHFPPGSFRCGQNCASCPYITNDLTRYTFYATGEVRSIPSHITCNTKNVIYMVQCNRCNLQYRVSQIGLSRFCSEKVKKLLRNMPKSCSKVAQNWKSCSKIL